MITDQILQPLLLLAIEPKLKGLLIAAGPGFGKSTLARAYRSLLPEPYIEIPINITEDRLLGGLDFERTIAAGTRHMARGLLVAAHTGTIYIDGINLFDTSITNHIATAVNDGSIRLERDGFSALHATNFLLVGTYDPAEGELHASLLDRIGLFIAPAVSASIDARVEIIERVMARDRKPTASNEDMVETAILRGLITEARTRLSRIEISYEDRRRLSLIGLELGVEGNRADIFATHAARAHAALAGRLKVDEEDIAVAVRFVLMPRATVIPVMDQNKQDSKTDSSENSRSNDRRDNFNNLSDELIEDSDAVRMAIENIIIKTLDSNLPEELLELPKTRLRKATIGSRGEVLNRVRGRHVRSSPGKLSEGKIALIATLRAAAIKQAERRFDELENRPVKIKTEDLHIKHFKQKAGMLFIFAVDASGSMALNRMNQAKGALTRLLQQAYVHRDKVALISFRGTRADIMLPPSQSVERAKRALDNLPVGGGTPMTAGLFAVLDLAKQARRAGIKQTVLLLFTDGRANVGLHTAEIADRKKREHAIQHELAQVGAALQYEGITSVVVDTQSRFTSGGAAQALANMIGGRYIYLPRADIKTVSNAVITIAETVRR
jgi:magnesium chelatase subunit D